MEHENRDENPAVRVSPVYLTPHLYVARVEKDVWETSTDNVVGLPDT